MTLDALVADLALRLAPHVTAASEHVSDSSGLLADESQTVAKAIPKRQAEFAAGRRAARRAMRPFGMGDAPVLTTGSRAPVWPQGIVGSITHDQGHAIALAAQTKHIAALGVDMTEAAPLPSKTRKSIAPHDQEGPLSEMEARAAFAIKECLFKTLHPVVKNFFGFEAAIAAPDFADNSFAVTLTTDLGDFACGTEFRGTLLSTQGLIVAALALPA